MQLTTNVRRRDFLVFRLSSQICPGFYCWLHIGVSLLLVWLAYRGAEFSVPMFIGSATYFLVIWLFLLLTTMIVAVFESLLIPALKKGVLGEHHFELTEDGLIEVTDVNRTLHSWSSVDRERKLFGALILRAGAGWHIFPKTAFRRDVTREQLLSAVRSFREKSA